MPIKWLFNIIIFFQLALYSWALYVFIFDNDGHVPVAYVVIHMVAGLNILFLVLGSIMSLFLKKLIRQILWSILIALPAIGIVIYLFLLRFI